MNCCKPRLLLPCPPAGPGWFSGSAERGGRRVSWGDAQEVFPGKRDFRAGKITRREAPGALRTAPRCIGAVAGPPRPWLPVRLAGPLRRLVPLPDPASRARVVRRRQRVCGDGPLRLRRVGRVRLAGSCPPGEAALCARSGAPSPRRLARRAGRARARCLGGGAAPARARRVGLHEGGRCPCSAPSPARRSAMAAPTTTGSFSRAELRARCAQGACLVLTGRSVYDLSAFAPLHPGGPRLLLERAGTDVSDALDGPPHRHSANARRWLQQYYLGELEPDGEGEEPPGGMLGRGGGLSFAGPTQCRGWKARKLKTAASGGRRAAERAGLPLHPPARPGPRLVAATGRCARIPLPSRRFGLS
ncbi:fatty acid 2-hydroxylase [Crotalus adamanteus]|uniref:Fatty acid 2-hydroxylase n=1 Tax=Crotalus adamanteus TaxID=8729 RepID=A0AAW1AT30_CROAD